MVFGEFKLLLYLQIQKYNQIKQKSLKATPKCFFDYAVKGSARSYVASVLGFQPSGPDLIPRRTENVTITSERAPMWDMQEGSGQYSSTGSLIWKPRSIIFLIF